VFVGGEVVWSSDSCGRECLVLVAEFDLIDVHRCRVSGVASGELLVSAVLVLFGQSGDGVMHVGRDFLG
jgi:hypothetical protein